LGSQCKFFGVNSVYGYEHGRCELHVFIGYVDLTINWRVTIDWCFFFWNRYLAVLPS